MSDEEKAYVGICPGCGSMSAAITASSGRERIADFCHEMIMDGREIGRATIEEVRTGLQRCKCPSPRPEAG
jgi:hypothetical protein